MSDGPALYHSPLLQVPCEHLTADILTREDGTRFLRCAACGVRLKTYGERAKEERERAEWEAKLEAFRRQHPLFRVTP